MFIRGRPVSILEPFWGTSVSLSADVCNQYSSIAVFVYNGVQTHGDGTVNMMSIASGMANTVSKVSGGRDGDLCSSFPRPPNIRERSHLTAFQIHQTFSHFPRSQNLTKHSSRLKNISLSEHSNRYC